MATLHSLQPYIYHMSSVANRISCRNLPNILINKLLSLLLFGYRQVIWSILKKISKSHDFIAIFYILTLYISICDYDRKADEFRQLGLIRWGARNTIAKWKVHFHMNFLESDQSRKMFVLREQIYFKSWHVLIVRSTGNIVIQTFCLIPIIDFRKWRRKKIFENEKHVLMLQIVWRAKKNAHLEQNYLKKCAETFPVAIKQNLKSLNGKWLIYHNELVIWYVSCLPVSSMRFTFYVLLHNGA